MPLQKGEGPFGRDAWVMYGSSSTKWEAVTGKGAQGFLSENNRLGYKRERHSPMSTDKPAQSAQAPHPHPIGPS